MFLQLDTANYLKGKRVQCIYTIYDSRKLGESSSKPTPKQAIEKHKRNTALERAVIIYTWKECDIFVCFAQTEYGYSLDCKI